MKPAERACLDSLIAALSKALAAEGFGGAAPAVKLDKVHRLTWRRPRDWKTDCVTLDYGRQSARPGVCAQVHVEFPDTQTGPIEIGTNVGYIIGRSDSVHAYPLLLSWRGPGFIRGVVADVLCALAWFERSATTSACRSLIAAEDTNISALQRDQIAALLSAVDH